MNAKQYHFIYNYYFSDNEYYLSTEYVAGWGCHQTLKLYGNYFLFADNEKVKENNIIISLFHLYL